MQINIEIGGIETESGKESASIEIEIEIATEGMVCKIPIVDDDVSQYFDLLHQVVVGVAVIFPSSSGTT